MCLCPHFVFRILQVRCHQRWWCHPAYERWSCWKWARSESDKSLWPSSLENNNETRDALRVSDFFSLSVSPSTSTTRTWHYIVILEAYVRILSTESSTIIQMMEIVSTSSYRTFHLSEYFEWDWSRSSGYRYYIVVYDEDWYVSIIWSKYWKTYHFNRSPAPLILCLLISFFSNGY